MTDIETTAADLDQSQWGRLLEALLFASPEPLSEKQLAERLPDGADLHALLNDLQARYAGQGVVLERFDKSWAFRTAPDLAGLLNVEKEIGRKLSRAAVETLATIAYHQPITRGEIEEIRGVALSKGTLDVLLEANWIKPRGRRRTPGRPMTWGTTGGFLDHFSLESIKDLPGLGELKSAGLLETGPAINVYTDRGDLVDQAESDAETEALEDAAAEDLLPEPLEEGDPAADDKENTWDGAGEP